MGKISIARAYGVTPALSAGQSRNDIMAVLDKGTRHKAKGYGCRNEEMNSKDDDTYFNNLSRISDIVHGVSPLGHTVGTQRMS